MLNHHNDTWRTTIPAWVKLGAVGLATVVLAQWVPAAIHGVLIVAGAIMMLGSIIWAREWVARLVPREQRSPRTSLHLVSEGSPTSAASGQTSKKHGLSVTAPVRRRRTTTWR